MPEETTRIALLRRGEVDIADVSRERVKELEREIVPDSLPPRGEAILTAWWILPRDGQPTKDKRVREALNLAIDRNEIAQSIFAGYADPAYVPLGLSWAYRDIGFKVTPEMQYPYDPARAKKLLADAGFANGFPLTMYAYQLPGLPEGKAFAEAMAGLLAEGRRPAEAGPGRLSGVPEELVRSRHARRVRLLQRRQPRLDRRLRLPREAGVHASRRRATP